MMLANFFPPRSLKALPSSAFQLCALGIRPRFGFLRNPKIRACSSNSWSKIQI